MKRDFFRTFLAKDRVEQGRSNPLFPTPKKPLWRKIFVLLALFVFLFGGMYLIFRFTTQDSFYINNINVTGITTLPAADVNNDIKSFLDKRRLLFFKEAHRYLLNKDKLSEKLENDFALDVQSVLVEGNTLTITILEDVLTSAVKNNGIWNLVTLDGKIIRPITDEEEALFTSPPLDRVPKIEIEAPVDVSATNTYLNPEFFESVLTLDEGVRALGLTPRRFLLRNEKEDWLRLNPEGKTYGLLFDLHKPLDSQLFMLKTVLHEYEGKEEGLNYIDLRFGNHVYVK
jgi:hypothetical protein